MREIADQNLPPSGYDACSLGKFLIDLGVTGIKRETHKELVDRGAEIVLGAPQLYVDVDIEADGIAGFGSMLALGAQSPTGESFYREIQPISEDFVPSQRQFCEEHWLERKRLVREGAAFEDVIKEFADWLKELEGSNGKSLVFTAFNAAFDWSFVDLYFKKAQLENPFGIAPLDLKSLALPLSGGWDFKQTAKGALPAIAVPEGDFTQNAMEDAQYQQKIHFALGALLSGKL